MEGSTMCSRADVLPDVELGEVREREGAEVLAGPHAALVELPQLGPLALGVPLTEGVAERQHPFLGPRLVLVAAGPAEGGVEAVLVDGVEQRGGLQAVARGRRAGIGHAALVDRVLHLGHDEPGAFGLHLASR